jgi:hypothetical protein
MNTRITNTGSRRIALASAVAVAWLLANPILPSGFDAGATDLGAAFARNGADDRPNDDGHHKGRHVRHGEDDGPNHDKNDDHGRHGPGHK